jgi:hypothetical protein
MDDRTNDKALPTRDELEAAAAARGGVLVLDLENPQPVPGTCPGCGGGPMLLVMWFRPPDGGPREPESYLCLACTAMSDEVMNAGRATKEKR